MLCSLEIAKHFRTNRFGNICRNGVTAIPPKQIVNVLPIVDKEKPFSGIKYNSSARYDSFIQVLSGWNDPVTTWNNQILFDLSVAPFSP